MKCNKNYLQHMFLMFSVCLFGQICQLILSKTVGSSTSLSRNTGEKSSQGAGGSKQKKVGGVWKKNTGTKGKERVH